ncbi:DUF4256 domain-containing protein [Pelomonas cellulosilytica]|uniref:DUF4256 domain-containing protein n=1 Tax=Pelomonas cellulosilytica TaxID=2906762 RepID=A0ABS8Y1D5_9BURK|nr:DUF4256 domain-containing protein [Pelomonas sp. P8]MCE4556731.1 DUF4256 domain-containing protein [Pelomonas sp. P8]
MTPSQSQSLIELLRSRFERHRERHAGLDWAAVQPVLEGNDKAVQALAAMEASGGEPDVIGRDDATGELLFCDCSAESPAGRRSLCYDQVAWESRRQNKPKGSATALAAEMGVELLSQDQYLALQLLGEFDLKTSSWIATPEDVRRLGGALFGDRRYGRVFTYHNGAGSYYAARGFRAVLRV